MARQKLHSQAWGLVRSQHGAVTRRQLLELGFTDEAVDHRIRTGRLHPVYRGVFAVGRPELTRYGRWMAATLACAPSGALSHGSAAALWGIGYERTAIEISVPRGTFRSQPGITLHRRTHLETTTHHRIPVTTPTATIIDLASYLPRNETEHAINEATDRKLTDPDSLRAAVDELPSRPGSNKLRDTLDVRTFTLTRSELERLFLPIARRAGLPKPLTKVYVSGFEVDFYWPELRLVVETDSLRFHRTPAQLTRDRTRDQTHTAAGLTVLRFTHGQVKYQPAHVEAILRSAYTSSIVSASSPTSRNDV